jgi:alcohol dehydrogenase class IV
MQNFITPFNFLTAGQIRFGRGTANSAAESVVRYGKRVLLVRGRSVHKVDEIKKSLIGMGCSVSTVFARGEPTIADVEQATSVGRENKADVVLAIGGGAVIDLGKAVAAMIPAQGNLMDYLEGVGDGRLLSCDPLPYIALPTTAGTGAEVTKNAVIGVPDAGRKVSLRDDRMLPRLAIVDPSLTDGAPAAVTFASGLDAVTQVIEPYLSIRANPLTDALCKSAIPMGLYALARLAKDEDPKARDEIAYVSLIGGIALANAGLGAVHGLAGVIGGRFSAPHGLICGRLLGPILSKNRATEVSKDALVRYSQIESWLESGLGLSIGSAFETLPAWLDDRDLPGLGNWLKPDTDIGAIASEAALSSSMKANPVVLSAKKLVAAIEEAL